MRRSCLARCSAVQEDALRALLDSCEARDRQQEIVSEVLRRLLGATVESVQQRLQLPRRVQGGSRLPACRGRAPEGNMAAAGTHSVLGAGVVAVTGGSTGWVSTPGVSGQCSRWPGRANSVETLARMLRSVLTRPTQPQFAPRQGLRNSLIVKRDNDSSAARRDGMFLADRFLSRSKL